MARKQGENVLVKAMIEWCWSRTKAIKGCRVYSPFLSSPRDFCYLLCWRCGRIGPSIHILIPRIELNLQNEFRIPSFVALRIAPRAAYNSHFFFHHIARPMCMSKSSNLDGWSPTWLICQLRGEGRFCGSSRVLRIANSHRWRMPVMCEYDHRTRLFVGPNLLDLSVEPGNFHLV